MIRSNSLHEMEMSDSMDELRQSGADLTEYSQELTDERNSRTLTLRRSFRRPVSGIYGSIPKPSPSGSRLSAFNPQPEPFLIPSYALQILNSGDDLQIIDLLENVINMDDKPKKPLISLSKSSDFVIALVSLLNSGCTDIIAVPVMKAIIVLFSVSDKNQPLYIDEGLCFSLMDNLTSVVSHELLTASISLIAAIAETSDYARDSILCLGIFQNLIDIATTTSNTELIEISCDAIHKIFSNSEPIDTSLLFSYVEPIVELLQLDSLAALRSVIATLVNISNKAPVVVFTYFELNIHIMLLEFLRNEQLMAVSLSLIGNMSVCQPSQVSLLLNNGLFDILYSMIDTFLSADVFWVLSNLLESVPGLMLGYFDQVFVARVVEIALSSSFDIKKEASFFLSTLILFSVFENVGLFIIPEVIEVLTDMHSCGVALVVLRSTDAILRFIQYIQITQSDPALLFCEDLEESLQELSESESQSLSARAKYVLKQLENLASCFQ